MSLNIKNNGSWSPVNYIYTNVNGVWTLVKKAWTKKNGVWQLYYPTEYATGGNSTTDINGYRYRVFTQSGQLNVIFPIDAADIFVLGGGGGGGDCNQNGCSSGGGGAGGHLIQTAVPLVLGTYNITVGQGAPGNAPSYGSAVGGNSTFTGAGISYTAVGGGNGGEGGGDQSGTYHDPDGTAGGCGGGGGGQGGSDHSHGNGGGGAGSQGGNGQSAASTGGAGGSISGTSGSGQGNPGPGLSFLDYPGVFGVGGYGYEASSPNYGPNSGNGGCGKHYNGGSSAQSGCSGIVIVRYPLP